MLLAISVGFQDTTICGSLTILKWPNPISSDSTRLRQQKDQTRIQMWTRRSGVCTITECIQGKAGQILVQLSVLSGPWDIFKNLTTDQPKGQPGLISMAEEEGKGKGKWW